MNADLDKYCFDTNCFIEPWNKFYSYKSYQSYWDDFILPNIRNDNILLLEEVWLEIKKGDDDLSAWFKENRLNEDNVLIKTDPNLTLQVKKLLKKYPRLSDSAKGRSIADSFLLEHARKSGSSVVTLEGFSHDLNKPRIPDVCKEENIPCIDLYQYIDKTGVSFHLQR